MARTYGPVLNTIGANPYNSAKNIEPEFFQCELCDRRIPSKNWQQHKVSKKHRAYEDEERRGKDNKENGPSNGDSGFSDTFGTGGDSWGGDSSVNPSDAPPSDAQGGWGATDDGNDGFSGVTRGAGNRACYGCGEEGHTKREW